jgi:hypothetical protein
VEPEEKATELFYPRVRGWKGQFTGKISLTDRNRSISKEPDAVALKKQNIPRAPTGGSR